MKIRFLILALCLILVSSCSKAFLPEVAPSKSQPENGVTTVKISFYGKGDGFAGKKTASGEIFNPNELTAAHRTLPFGTKLSLENPQNGKSVSVRVNDRGPAINEIELDVSHAAAIALGITQQGIADVKMRR